MRKIFLLALGLMFIFSACQKDIDTFIPNPTVEPPVVTYIIADIGGTIVDEMDQPVANANVQIGTTSTTTDERGIFLIKDVSVPEGAAFVKATKDGYFLGSKTVYSLAAPSIANVKIKLLSNEIIGSVDATNGGEVSLPTGGKINFPPGSVADASGAIYTGQVNVAAKWLDPTANDLGEIMPGSLLGINADGQEQALATMGMMAVELTGSAGEALNVAADQEVALTFPIPAEVMNAAAGMPTIPLWSFNEETGVWEEEGFAELVGDTYVGKVTHFSFWNCDAPFPLIVVKGTILDVDGNGVVGATVKIRFPDACTAGYGLTDSRGCYGGKIPKDELLILQVCNACGDPIIDIEIGPFSEDTTIPDLILDDNTETIQVSGDLVDCNGDDVTNGYAIVSTGNTGQAFFVDDNGDFSGSMLDCGEATITVSGIDIANLKESLPATFASASSIDAGTIMVCNDLAEYILYNLDGTDYLIVESFSAGAEADMYIQIHGDNLDSLQNINLNFQADMPGEYELDSFSANNIWSDTQNPNGINVTTTLTDFPVIGNPFIGTFDGTFLDWQGNPHTITGSYKVNRQY